MCSLVPVAPYVRARTSTHTRYKLAGSHATSSTCGVAPGNAASNAAGTSARASGVVMPRRCLRNAKDVLYRVNVDAPTHARTCAGTAVPAQSVQSALPPAPPQPVPAPAPAPLLAVFVAWRAQAVNTPAVPATMSPCPPQRRVQMVFDTDSTAWQHTMRRQPCRLFALTLVHSTHLHRRTQTCRLHPSGTRSRQACHAPQSPQHNRAPTLVWVSRCEAAAANSHLLAS